MSRSPDGFKQRKMEKWKRIIEPDGDSDSSMDCWEASMNKMAYLADNKVSNNLSMTEREGVAGPSGTSHCPAHSNSGSMNVPQVTPVSMPCSMMPAPSTSTTGSSNGISRVQNPHIIPSDTPSTSRDSRVPAGVVRRRNNEFDPATFENRIRRLRDRLRERHILNQARDYSYRRPPNKPLCHGPMNSTSGSYKQPMQQCRNNPDWIKLSGQNVNPRVIHSWFPMSMGMTSSGGMTQTTYTPDQWDMVPTQVGNAAPPPAHVASNPAHPPNNSEIPSDAGNISDVAPEDRTEPLAEPAAPSEELEQDVNLNLIEIIPEEQIPPPPKRPCLENNPEGENSNTVSTPAAAASAENEPDKEKPPTSSSSEYELNNNILTMLECPVCLEFMAPPIHQCRRGHLVCLPCRTQLLSCPTCRSRFTDLRNLALERIADIIYFPCKNEECGKSFKLCDKTDHELNCCWRLFSCMAQGCNWSGLHQGLLQHMQDQHSELILSGDTHELDLPIDANFNRNYVISSWGALFRANLQRGPGQHQILGIVQFLGPVAQAANYSFQFDLHSINTNGIKRSVTFQRTTHTDCMRLAQAYNSGDAFSIGVEQAKFFIEKKKIRLKLRLEHSGNYEEGSKEDNTST